MVIVVAHVAAAFQRVQADEVVDKIRAVEVRWLLASVRPTGQRHR